MIIQEWEKTNITAAAPTTTLVFSGKGVLHSVVINKPLANGSIVLYDALTATNAFATIVKPGTLLSDSTTTTVYDCVIKTGLCVVTSGAAQDITIMWQK